MPVRHNLTIDWGMRENVRYQLSRSMNRIRLASGAAVGRRGQDVDRGSLVSVATPMLSLQGKFNVIY